MTDPVVSNVRMSARPDVHPAPAEGLPPCRSHARFDGRRVSMIDTTKCDGGHHFQAYSARRFFVLAGYEKKPFEHDPHGWQAYWLFGYSIVIKLLTDDPDEAQAAFDKGAEWVRTGTML